MPLTSILKLAGTIAAHLVSSNFIMDIAVKHNYSYSDYRTLCRCLARVPMTEVTYMAQAMEHSQLSLEGIY